MTSKTSSNSWTVLFGAGRGESERDKEWKKYFSATILVTLIKKM